MTAGDADLESGKGATVGREWYFAEDGSLAEAAPAPRLQEWLGMGYALVGLALSSPAWVGLGDRGDGRRHEADAGARPLA